MNPLGPHMVRLVIPRMDPLIFSDPHQVILNHRDLEMHNQALQRARDAGQAPVNTLPCYSLGNVAEHFRAYFKKIYNRAKFMEQFIGFCSECSWINQGIESFRDGAEILNDERDGIVLTYIAADDVIGAGFLLHAEYEVHYNGIPVGETREKNIYAEDRNLGVPFTHELIRTFSFYALDEGSDGSTPSTSTYFVPSSIENKDVISARNNTSTAFPVYSGTTKILDVPARSASGVPGSGNIPASAFRERVSFVAPRS